MLSRLLDPKNDFAFKKIFGTKKNQDIPIALLNEVLKKQLHKKVDKVQFLSPIQEPEVRAKKQSVVDVLCEDQDGCQYIVEMQVANRGGFEERAQYYASKAFVSQMQKGEDYTQLKEVIFLAFTNYSVFPKKKEYKSEHITLDKKTLEHDLNKISFTFVDLVKFEQQRPKDISKLSLEEKFYYFLHQVQELNPEELEKLSGKDTIIKKAINELNRSSWTEEELRHYEDIEKANLDNETALQYAIEKAEQKTADNILSLIRAGKSAEEIEAILKKEKS